MMAAFPSISPSDGHLDLFLLSLPFSYYYTLMYLDIFGVLWSIVVITVDVSDAQIVHCLNSTSCFAPEHRLGENKTSAYHYS